MLMMQSLADFRKKTVFEKLLGKHAIYLTVNVAMALSNAIK